MIKFKTMKMKEYRAYAKDLDEIVKVKAENTVEQIDSNIKLAQLMGRYILEWDFKDDDVLLDIPSVNPDVIEELNTQQLAEIFTSFAENHTTKVPNSKGDNS